jgi:hypothetical protein
MLARNSFFIGPLIGRDGCRPEVFFFFLPQFVSFLLGPGTHIERERKRKSIWALSPNI